MARKKTVRQYTYRRKHFPTTPFTTWLCDYAEEHRISMIGMSLEAGLSRGVLNGFLKEPWRKPGPSTILKLSMYTGKPAGEIAQLAGIAGYRPSYMPEGDADPGIDKLVTVYKRLPVPMQHYVLRGVVALDKAVKELESHSKDKQ